VGRKLRLPAGIPAQIDIIRDMADGALISIAIVLGLIALGGIFVAAEIALISLRESQVKQLASKGKRGARVAKLASNPNRFLAAVQVGITLCGFLSAAFGAEQLGTYVIPALKQAGFSEQASEILSIVGITLVIVYISLVFGELVPKRLALFKTEKIALATAAIIDRVAIVFKPIIWLLSHSTDLIVKIFGITAQSERTKISDVELMELVSGHTDLSAEEREIVEEVFNTSDRLIHEVMVPRTEVDFLDASLTISEARKSAAELAHSRYPVVRGSSDEIIGFLHVRDLLNPKLDDAQITIMEIIRHIAIVLDEYGGTDGIITLENLVECLIGEIHDEYDGHESEPKPEQRTGDIEIDGLTSLEDLADLTGITLPEGPYETVSGFVMNYLGRIAQVGDVVRISSARFTITSMIGKRVGQILLSKEDRK